MIERYFKPTVDIAQKLGAQVGNTLSAFADPVLQDPNLFAQTSRHVDECLVQMAQYAGEKGVLFGYEQMYSPIQGMWTIDGCKSCMERVTKEAGEPMYITIDTAHQVAQHLFNKPSVEDIVQMQKSKDMSNFRLPDVILDIIVNGMDTDKALKALDKYDYWFARPHDSDVFEWFTQAGCYSPIVHLQQTDGTYSGHKPFTKK